MNLRVVCACVLAACALGCSEPDEAERLAELDRGILRGDYEHVIQEAGKYVREHPDSYRGWNTLGWAYVKSGQVEKADECFDTSIRINDQWDNAYVGKGVVCRKTDRPDEARQWYLKAIEREPDNPQALSSLLTIELLDGNDRKAIEYGEKAWALEKDHPSVAANLSVAYHYAGDLARRDAFYEHARRLSYHDLQALRDIFDGTRSIR